MIKSTIFVLILLLIICTSLIKNSTKDLDEKIYSKKENLSFLKNRFKDSKLEYDYLSSSEKLLEYQKIYFDKSLVKKPIEEIKIIEFKENKIFIDDLKILGEKDE